MNKHKHDERRVKQKLAGGYWRYRFYCNVCGETLRYSDEQPPERPKKKGKR